MGGAKTLIWHLLYHQSVLSVNIVHCFEANFSHLSRSYVEARLIFRHRSYRRSSGTDFPIHSTFHDSTCPSRPNIWSSWFRRPCQAPGDYRSRCDLSKSSRNDDAASSGLIRRLCGWWEVNSVTATNPTFRVKRRFIEEWGKLIAV